MPDASAPAPVADALATVVLPAGEASRAGSGALAEVAVVFAVGATLLATGAEAACGLPAGATALLPDASAPALVAGTDVLATVVLPVGAASRAVAGALAEVAGVFAVGAALFATGAGAGGVLPIGVGGGDCICNPDTLAGEGGTALATGAKTDGRAAEVIAALAAAVVAVALAAAIAAAAFAAWIAAALVAAMTAAAFAASVAAAFAAAVAAAALAAAVAAAASAAAVAAAASAATVAADGVNASTCAGDNAAD